MQTVTPRNPFPSFPMHFDTGNRHFDKNNQTYGGFAEPILSDYLPSGYTSKFEIVIARDSAGPRKCGIVQVNNGQWQWLGEPERFGNLLQNITDYIVAFYQ